MKYQNTLRITSIILFLGLLSASFAHAQTENYTLVKSWGSYGNGNMQFDEPSGITIDSSGNIYVADTNNNRIIKFDNNGTFLTKWDGSRTSSGQMFPLGIAVDSSDNVYVTDASINKVFKFNSNGSFINEFGSEKLDVGTAVAVDSYGNVYVSDQFNHTILIFDSNGNYKTNWNLGSSSYYDSWDIAVDSSGNVYVTFPHLNIVEKFDSNGKYLTNYGSTDNNDGQLEFPIDVAVDSYDNVYIADNKGIHKFYNNGTFITKWGSYNSSGLDSTPYGLAVDSSGNVYVDDSWNNRIQKFAPNPVANFTTNVTYNGVNIGRAPLTIQFNDTSTGSPTNWIWEFGDGNTSTEQNPVYTYYQPGNYTVNLTVSNAYSSNSTNQTIQVMFLPNPNGYHFRNADIPYAIHTRDEFKNAFNVDISTTLNMLENPRAEIFYEKFFGDSSRNGNCYGMSSTSMVLYNKGYYNTYSNNMEDLISTWKSYMIHFNQYPSTVRDWIEYYQPLQFDNASLADRSTLKGFEIVYDTLKQHLLNGNADMVLTILGTFQGSSGASHAVIPYKFVESSDKKSAIIYVYDCNYPNNPNIYIKIDKNAGLISSNNGFTHVDNVYLTSLKAFNENPQIPSWIDFIRYGLIHLRFYDPSGMVLGYDQGAFKDEINGTCPITPTDDVYNNKSMEAYYVPDPSIKMELCGNGTGDSETSMITPKGLITADVPVSPTSVDQLKVLNNGTGIRFIPEIDTSRSLGLMLDVESPGSTQVVNASISQIEVGGSVNLSNVNGTVTIQNNGLPRTCNMSLEQDTDNQNSSAIINDIAVYADSTVHVVPSNWNDLSNSTISIDDVGSNGTVYYNKTINSKNTLVMPRANFTANVTQGYVPLDVQFTDQSQNATHLEWNFGDNTGNTSDANPEHMFTTSGLYNVVLTASNDNGSDIKSMTINVTAPPALQIFPGCTNPPKDLNGDGLYEDINGNGRLDFADVVTYFNNMAWITQNEPVAYFDYNRNGRIDFSDVVNLFNMKSS